jgi:hypothetical protein
MDINNIYVRKNLSSLDELGKTTAYFLKRGYAIQLQYGEKERDFIIRFHKRMGKLYHDDLENHEKVVYPTQGFVVYDINKATTSETKIEKVEGNYIIKGIFNLVYDPFFIKEIVSHISSSLEDLGCDISSIKKKYDERERW